MSPCLYSAFNILSELGLTYPQYLVMTLLWHGDNRTVKAIGQELGLASSTLTPLLKRLEGRGLVLRRRDTEDERVVRIALTAAGAGMSERAKEIPCRVIEATGMSTEAVDDLIHKLGALQRAISTASDPRWM